MSLQCLVSDFVARVNNGVLANNHKVVVLKNKLIINIAKKLTRLGYFKGFQTGERDLLIELDLNKLSKLKRISKPGHRIYTSYQKLPRILGGRGFNILTTSAGVKTQVEAKADKVGGELLFQIY